MFKLVNSSKIVSDKEVNQMYPNSMFILQDVKDPSDVKGVWVAVSTSRDSYRDICIKRKELADSGVDCALLGSYNGGVIGVLSRYE